MRELGLLRTPLFSRYFSSLIGVGYDSSREKSLTTTLVISTFLLSFASGFTTWLGLLQYVPWSVALMITAAIQGLLFVTSWRLGATLTARKFKVSL